MPPKRKGQRNNTRKPSEPDAPLPTNNVVVSGAMSDCKLPEDLMLSILTRLPVKTVRRYKCVCKPWLKLFSTTEFIKMHHEQTAKNPQNHSLIIHSIDEDYYHNMSLLNVNSTAEEPTNLVNPFPVIFKEMDLVGCVNGLVCLSCPPFAQMIVLWNPALSIWKAIRLPNRGIDESIDRISLGFAYDESKDDYKIVRITIFKPDGNSPKNFLRAFAEVYSANLDSWKRVRLSFQFSIIPTRSNVIVKGRPYWTAIIYDPVKMFREVMLWYDVENEVFRHVPVPDYNMDCTKGGRFVEWKGSLAILVYSPTRERDDFVDVVVYDEGKGRWDTKSCHGPIGLKMERHMQCSKDGVILAETPEGTLFLYDPMTNAIKEFRIAEAMKTSYEAFSYTESLVSLKGMEKVEEQDKDKFCIKMEDLVID
ncbi:F-box/kelch-repeat protein At3g06240 [Coffea arabica]|uniref:F-box/kelch-repeat protein At3g06240 n=1 Tax=Coffea arabica TaxID=13443 RepID=A0A6P6T651_COFAR|nr:F-box/kelch-repeat protein At3g06240-like [Coffea arabica]XP_027073818.1 F-box/kelch-repeat protein At3g06240-like [Coffea arabica]XP_027073819.1 F-box/kelch-repeat protein At3g06240-like [Coffea arabica]